MAGCTCENWTLQDLSSALQDIRKYDTFEEDGFKIHGYNREEMRTLKKVNAFEYLFGLSKFAR